MTRRGPVIAAVAAIALAGAGSSVSVSVARGDGAAARGVRITFGDVTCAPSWPAPQPGRDRYTVTNESSRSATVYLFRADSGAILATLRRVRPGTSRGVDVTIAAGKPYAWGCDLKGYPTHESDPEKALGQRQPGGTGPVVVPVQTQQLAGPLRVYRRYAASRIEALRGQVAGLRRAISRGRLMGARRAWERAHLTWLSIGQDDGAYGAFGPLGRSLDGTAAGYVGGTHSPRFTGFHRVEWALWGHGGLRAAGPEAAELGRLVAQLESAPLTRAMPATKLGVQAWTLRPHEVLEDALRDTLSGDDDLGSNTAVPDLQADVAVTRRLIGLLTPLLVPRAPGLVGTIRAELNRLSGELATAQRRAPDRPVARWPATMRYRIDGEVGAALQSLDRVPDLLAVGTT